MLDSLDQRSRAVLAVGFVVILLLLLGFFIRSQARKTVILKRQINAAEQDIGKVYEMDREIKQLKSTVKGLPKPLRGRPVELFSILEKLMKGLGIEKSEMRIRPLAGATKEEFQEKKVEVRAGKLSMKTLVDLLYSIEKHPSGLRPGADGALGQAGGEKIP